MNNDMQLSPSLIVQRVVVLFHDDAPAPLPVDNRYLPQSLRVVPPSQAYPHTVTMHGPPRSPQTSDTLRQAAFVADAFWLSSSLLTSTPVIRFPRDPSILLLPETSYPLRLGLASRATRSMFVWPRLVGGWAVFV